MTVAADSSSLIAHFNDMPGEDVHRLRAALASGQLVLPPVVLTEVLSDPGVDAFMEENLEQIVRLDLREGYWTRAGQSRRLLLAKGLKARVGDALIAQACIDHDVALITRDRDFRHFAEHCGLRLA
ncbi:MAG: PIN domain-containing protein [Rhizobiales bacterium]|nr:PIN domain-containing protein [Hyphomicrobiales bacterium]